jgi:Tol biopolymer transport system component
LSVHATYAGVILGTAAYMSPEQANGKAVDRQSDVWSFGSVLYEMLAGRPAFEGETISEIVAAVLKTEPDWTRLPQSTPPSIARLLRRCLYKDRKRRLRDIADAALEFDDAGVDSDAPASIAQPGARRRERLAWASAVAILGLSAGAAAIWAIRPMPRPPEMRLEISTPPTTDLPSLAISPDGRAIVFAAALDGRPRLWLRPLDAAPARPLAGTDDARLPFWSPDSRSVGFFADGHLKRIDIDAGSVRILANTTDGAGGSWSRDGTIVYAPANALSQLLRVSSDGGESSRVALVDAGQYRYPQFLPDGRRFIVSATGTADALVTGDGRSVIVGDVDGAKPSRLLDAEAAWYSGGHLLFVRQGTLFAQRFDVESLTLSGAPWALTDQLASTSSRPAVSTSDAGTVIYRAGAGDRLRQLVWIDRSGAEMSKLGDPIGNALNPSLAPDGRRVALNMGVAGNTDIWVFDARGVLNRFTTNPAIEAFPVWSPDGRWIAFNSIRGDGNNIYRKPVDNSEEETLLLATAESKQPSDWSPDGRFIMYRSRNRDGADADIWMFPLTGDRKPFAVVNTKFNERHGQFSPDSRWIAYESDESGRFEVYVQPFPGPGGRERISTRGGVQVRWRRDGREIFYVALDGRLMAVPIRVAPERAFVDIGTPVPLFPTHIGGALQPVTRQQYAVSADGQQFLMNTVPEETSSTPITVILNWKPKE